jgi:uncharacterized protein (DUF849 family)
MVPLILNLAPTGLVPTRQQSPHIPLSAQEIAADVTRCAQLGVSMVHLHARNPDGSASDDPALFADIIERIRSANPQLVIITTTSGRRNPDVARRGATLTLSGDVKPDMASLTLGSMNFATEASLNAPATIMRLAEMMAENGIRPELEVFDLGMINYAKILIDKGLIQPPYYFNILLGNPGTAQATLLHLASLINDLPAQSVWSLAGIGRFQTKANALGVVLGDGVRVGLEDNLWLDDERSTLATNAQLIERVVAQANALGRAIASPGEVRQRLGLRMIGE